MTPSVSLVLTVSVEVSSALPDRFDDVWPFSIQKLRYISELDLERSKGFGSKSKIGAVAEGEAAVDEFSVLHQRPRSGEGLRSESLSHESRVRFPGAR